MLIQQEHLPKDKPATSEEEWGYSLFEFLEGNWEYLLAFIFVLAVFLYARYSWKKRHLR